VTTRPASPLPARAHDLLCRLCATGYYMRLTGDDLNAVRFLEERGLAEHAWFSAHIYRSTDAGDACLFEAPT
jgi:hypothetical protein